MPTDIEQFGRGIVCPFQWDGKGDFANGAGHDLLRSDIGELLGIMGPAATKPGELPWRMDVGSRLQALRHRKLHSEMIRATAEQMTAGPVRQWEPRVRVGRTSVAAREDNTLEVRLEYTPVGYRQEASTVTVATVEE